MSRVELNVLCELQSLICVVSSFFFNFTSCQQLKFMYMKSQQFWHLQFPLALTMVLSKKQLKYSLNAHRNQCLRSWYFVFNVAQITIHHTINTILMHTLLGTESVRQHQMNTNISNNSQKTKSGMAVVAKVSCS